MTRTFSGGCACGAIRYEIACEPVFQNHCQCLDCRKRSGTGHGSYLTFADRAAVRVEGEAATWRTSADSGNDKHHAFCPVCGTPMFLTLSAMPALFIVTAGSLDDPGQFEPQALTYASRGLPWDTTDAALAAFERMPQ